jgi:hypothetical protein
LRNEDGNTALSYACLRGNLDIVKTLHQKGAIMGHRNSAGLTPLLIAIYHQHYFVVHYLLSVESVYESIVSPLDLYKCLQFSISSVGGGSSFQIFYMLYEVFESKIEDVFSSISPSLTIWDLRVNPHQEGDLVAANGLTHIGSNIGIYQQ